MKKQDMLKVQTCVLRVNIHCEGCMHKVKKKLQKVKGVYKVSIDSEQGKVIVSGNADPATLIEKLEKAGKHAQLWGGPPQKPVPVFISNHQFNKFQLNKGNHHEPHKNGNEFLQIPKEKGFKDNKLFSAKDHKSVSFHLPREKVFDDDDEEEFDDDDDEFDDDEEFDDEEFDEGGFDSHKPLAKAKGDKEGKGKKGGGGGGIDVFLKGMLKKAGRKRGDSDKKSKMKEDGRKKGGFEMGDFKKGENEDGRSRKGGESFDFDGGKKHQQQQQGFNEMKANHKVGGGGGRNMEMMGQKGGYPAMNGGRFMPNNPYSHQQQQQFMAHMMMKNQNGQGGHHPSAYGRSLPPAMSYGPLPPMMYGPPHATTEHYSHMFSDENTGSCSIM